MLVAAAPRAAGTGPEPLLPAATPRMNAITQDGRERPCVAYCRWRLKKLANAVIASRDSGNSGFSQKEVPHALEHVEIRFHPGVAKFAVQQHRLAQAHVTGSGKQKSGRVVFRNVAVKR